MRAWRDWTRPVPEETSTVGRLMQFPPTPDVPEPLRGRPFVIVEAFHLGEEAESGRIDRSAGWAGTGHLRHDPPIGLSEIHMDPTEPLAADTEHLVLSELTPT